MEEKALSVPSVDFYGERPDWLPPVRVIKCKDKNSAKSKDDYQRLVRSSLYATESTEAVLSNQGGMTSFKYGKCNVRFRTPSKLVRYTEIKEWDKGYLVVMVDYGDIGIVEEYIDLVPILRNLYINPDIFLANIQTVKIGGYDS